MSPRDRFDKITITEEPAREGVVDSLQGLLGAYNSLGFEQGYARATRYLLATLPLLIEEFDKEHVGVTSRDREILKLFAGYLEGKLTGELPPHPQGIRRWTKLLQAD